MAEETVWRGTSSQVKNSSTFVLCVLGFCAIVVIFVFLWLNPSSRSFSPHIFWLALVPTFIALARLLQTKISLRANDRATEDYEERFHPRNGDP